MEIPIKEALTRFLGHKTYLQSKPKNGSFYHIDCRFSKKKFCDCSQFTPYEEDKKLSSLIKLISSNEFKIDLKNKKFVYSDKVNYNDAYREVINEQVKLLNEEDKDFILKEFKGNSLSNREFNEVYHSIQKEKKYCENCNMQLTDNNYHKGWKNPNTGEAVLLCTICNKKYVSGVLEQQPSASIQGFKREETSYLNPTTNTFSASNFKVSSTPMFSTMNMNSQKQSFRIMHNPN